MKEYFQDDVYQDVRSCVTPAVDVSDWIEGSDGEIMYESMRPDDMPLLSERVVTRVARSKTEAFRQEIQDKEKVIRSESRTDE